MVCGYPGGFDLVSPAHEELETWGLADHGRNHAFNIGDRGLTVKIRAAMSVVGERRVINLV